MKTIDIQAKEWFDRVNGNSYFSATVTVNYKLDDERTIYLPFQYGYGSHYVDQAARALDEAGLLPGLIHHDNGSTEGISRYCDRRGIILRNSKQEGCRKKELITRKEAEQWNSQEQVTK